MNFIRLKRRENPAPLRPTSDSGAADGQARHPAESPSTTGTKYLLDTIGQVCPFPLVEAKRAIEPLNPGDELRIDFDCTQATDSIPA